MQNEADKLAERGHSAFPPELVEKINRRLAWAKAACDDSWEDVKASASNAVSYKSRSFPTPPRDHMADLLNNVSYVLLGLGLGGLVFQRLQRS